MVAAGPRGEGAKEIAARAPAGVDVLERVARLASRAADADRAMVFARDQRDPRSLVCVASHGDGAQTPDDAALMRALETGAATLGSPDGGQCAAAPMAWGGRVRGVLAIAGGTRRRRFGSELALLEELAGMASAALEEAERLSRLEEIVDAGVAALVRAVDMRDNCTARHSESVGEFAHRVGERLGMAGPELWLLDLGARLHDVGKIGVPDAILNKPGPLDAGEWETMRRHAELGAEMVAKVPGLEPVAPVVRSHHERWDGLGYPDGLDQEEIPLASRVIAACDAFHAMVSDRPYRAALDVDAAFAELTAGSGTQFDPNVVGALFTESAAVRTAPMAVPART